MRAGHEHQQLTGKPAGVARTRECGQLTNHRLYLADEVLRHKVDRVVGRWEFGGSADEQAPAVPVVPPYLIKYVEKRHELGAGACARPPAKRLADAVRPQRLAPLEHRDDQRLLRLEVVIKRALGDTDGLDDFVEPGGVEAVPSP